LSNKRRFWQFFSQKVQETAFFRRCFCVFQPAGAYLPPLTPSTTIPCPGPPPANSWHTKHFFSCPRRASDYGRGMTSSLPLSYWSPWKSYLTPSHTATYFFTAIHIELRILCTFAPLPPLRSQSTVLRPSRWQPSKNSQSLPCETDRVRIQPRGLLNYSQVHFH
jgi:hypothetical protein